MSRLRHRLPSLRLAVRRPLTIHVYYSIRVPIREARDRRKDRTDG